MIASIHLFDPLTVHALKVPGGHYVQVQSVGFTLYLMGQGSAAAGSARALAAQLLTVADQIDAELPAVVVDDPAGCAL